MFRFNNLIKYLFVFFINKYRYFEAKKLYQISKVFNLNSEAIELNVNDIKKSKDTVFIMGSGYSINDISKEEWEHFKQNGDIFSFNFFFKGNFVPIQYHLVREMKYFRSVLFNKDIFKSYCNNLFKNPHYKNSIFFILSDFKSPAANWSVFFLKLFKDKKICFYKNLKDRTLILPPSEDIKNMPHCSATLFDVINISYILGYKKIVLVGIDLYDRRYFWLGEKETHEGDLMRGANYSDIHNTARHVLEAMILWRDFFEKKGIKVYIYNPRSLLSDILPIYQKDAIENTS